MNALLIFFAFPIAVIILSAVLQTIIKCPTAIASMFFAIFLVITFAFYDANFLIETIVYTILAFISAVLTNLIFKLIENQKINETINNDNKENANISNICYEETNDTTNNIRPFNYDGKEKIYRCRRA